MFKQEILDFNFNQASNNEDVQVSHASEEIFKALRTELEIISVKPIFKKAVIGLSGGIDSALTAL